MVFSSHRDGVAAIDPRYAMFRLAVTMLLATIGSAGLWSYVIVLPAVQSEFGVDRATASIPYTTTMIFFALGNIVVGRLIDRIGMMLPALAAGVSLGLGFSIASQVEAMWQLSIVHGVLIGIGTGSMFGPLMANISHWFVRRRGIAVATVACGNYFAGMLLPLVLQDSVVTEGWRPIYLAIGAFSVVTIAPLALLLRKEGPKHDHIDRITGVAGTEQLRMAAFTPRTMQTLLAVAGFGCCVAMSMPQVHIVAYCVDLGYGLARGAEMLSVMLAAGVVSRLAFGVLADYIGGVRTLLLGSVLQCVALTLYLPFDGLASLYAVSFIFGLFQGGIVPSYALIIREYLPAREAGRRIGTVIFATIGGMAFGGWVTGWIYDVTASYQVALLNGIAFNFVNMAVMALILWRTVRAQPAAA